jgi:hypothetical protein
MATVRIEEFSGMSLDHKGFVQVPQLPLTAAAQTIISSGASAASAALATSTRVIGIRATGGKVAVRVGGGTPVALTTDAGVNDGEYRWFGIDPVLAQSGTAKIAAIEY